MYVKLLGVVTMSTVFAACAVCQTNDSAEAGGAMIAPAPFPVTPILNDQRMFGILPDYQTVRDPHATVPVLTNKDKFLLLEKGVIDPFNIASALMGAGLSQMGDQTPKYGIGTKAMGKRMGAAIADMNTQALFATTLACVLHQDPRYYRKGSEYSVLKRTAYSISRLAVTRTDAGKNTFNSSGLFGMALGIGASNLYYPSASANTGVMMGRLNSSLQSGVIGNLMSEFWPDLQQKFMHRHRRSR